METQKSAPMKGLLLLLLTRAWSGALVGLYVGLSTSPIVSTIVGTLAHDWIPIPARVNLITVAYNK
jgi:hypothetical protein